MSYEPVLPTTTIPPMTYQCMACGQTVFPHSTVVHICPAWNAHPQYSAVLTPPMEAVNDLIAVEPFKNDLTEVVQKGTGFNTMKGATSLTGCRVVYGNKDYPAGITVYVRAELAKEPGSKPVEVEGAKVTFISVKEIRLVKRYDPDWNKNPMSITTNQPGPFSYGKVP